MLLFPSSPPRQHHAQFEMNLDSYQLAQFEIDCKKLLLYNANQPAACAIGRLERSGVSHHDHLLMTTNSARLKMPYTTQDSNALPTLNNKSQECILPKENHFHYIYARVLTLLYHDVTRKIQSNHKHRP